MNYREIAKDFIRKTWDLRDGEYQRVFLMQLNIFLIVFALLIIKPVVNAQFLAVIGIEKLPLVFVLVAIFAMAVSTLYSKALHGRSLRRVNTLTLYIAIISLITVSLLLSFQIAVKPVLYIFYVATANFGVLVVSQFWVMANLAFNPREAKRLLGLIGAGAIAGGVAGGYVTSILSSFIDGPKLLWVAGLALAACIPVYNTIWKKHIKTLNRYQQSKRLPERGEHPIWLISKSKHLTFLALIIGLSVIVAKLVEFQFSSIAAQIYSNTSELTGFFGFWFSTFNVISLIIQLFITHRVVGKYGVGSSLLILPGGLVLGSIMLMVAPFLSIVIFLKMWDISVKQSINKAATELMALPIPENIKSQTKSFIDVFIDMSATGISGLLLIFLINGFDLSIRAVTVLVLVILALWLWVAFRIRREYLNSFREKIALKEKDVHVDYTDFTSTSVISGLKRVLESGTEKQIQWVLEQVEHVPDKGIYKVVDKMLDHPSAIVQLAAFRCIYALNKVVSNEKLEQFIEVGTSEMKVAAFSQLVKQTRDNKMLTIKKYLHHENPEISNVAMLGIAQEIRSNGEMKKHLKFKELLQMKIEFMNMCDAMEERIHYKIMILKATGLAQMESLYWIIDEALLDEDAEIRKNAIYAAGYSLQPKYIHTLLSSIKEKELKAASISSLQFYGLGIIPDLLAFSKSHTTELEVIRQIPEVLSGIPFQASVDALFNLLESPDVTLRLETLRALNQMQKDAPFLRIKHKRLLQLIFDEIEIYRNILAVMYKQNELLPKDQLNKVYELREKLISLLESRLDATLERIFRLLGLKYPPEDVIPAYLGIKNVNQDIRSHSVEFLDNLLEPNLKKYLIPVAETAMMDGITKQAISVLKMEVPDEFKCFKILLKGRDPRLKVVVFNLMREIKDPSFLPLIKPHLNSPFNAVREAASWTLKSLEEK